MLSWCLGSLWKDRAMNSYRPAALGLALLLCACSAATAKTIVARSDTELAEAVAAAGPGDRIELRPGRYGRLLITNRRIGNGSIIVTGKDATVSNIEIVRSEGWTIDGLTIGGAKGTRGRVVFIQDSSRISVRNSLVHGIIYNNDPWDSGEVGIGVRNGWNIDVTGNRFRDLAMAFVAGSSGDVRFEGNSVAYVREGSNWVAVKTASVRCNRFSHFYPNWIRKEHPDAMQGWWNKDGNNENFLIEGNVLMLGGPRSIQGIFFAGARLPKDDHERGRLRNFTIRDNIYFGSSLHGISLSGVENAVLERNTVLASPHAQQPNPPSRSEDGRRSSALVPRIRILWDGSTGAVSGNIASKYQLPPLVQQQGNVTVPYNRSKAWSKVVAGPVSGDDPALSAFVPHGDVGARAVCNELLPPPVDAPSGPDPSSPEWIAG